MELGIVLCKSTKIIRNNKIISSYYQKIKLTPCDNCDKGQGIFARILGIIRSKSWMNLGALLIENKKEKENLVIKKKERTFVKNITNPK